MSSFSITPKSEVDIVDQYTDFLSKELNDEIWCVNEEDVYNPFLLQQMGVLRASRIQKAVETNGAILYQGLRYTNDSIKDSSCKLAQKIASVAPVITSSLDRGFQAMHYSLDTINESMIQSNQQLDNINSSLGVLNKGVQQSNQNIQFLTAATVRGLGALYDEHKATNQQLQNIGQSICALGGMIGQGLSILHERINATNTLLESVLEELRIPETQRERRYHIEEGAKYLAMALSENDKLYYEDAIAEFEDAIKLERKDFYSWYSLGFIYMRSVYHVDIQKAVDALERFVHYARAEAIQRNNQSLKLKIDEAYLLMAEAHYLLQDPSKAIQLTEQCVSNKEKASFMRVKYLSYIGDDTSQKLAADILQDLLEQNPFLSLQVLEDADVIGNKYVVSLLDKLRMETVSRARKEWAIVQQVIGNLGTEIIKLFDRDLNKIIKLIDKNSYLDAIESLWLLDKLKTDAAVCKANNEWAIAQQVIEDLGSSKPLVLNNDLVNIRRLIDKNSYLDAIEALWLLDKLKTDATVCKANNEWAIAQQVIEDLEDLGSSKPLVLNNDLVNIRRLIDKNSYLDAIEAIDLLKKLVDNHMIREYKVGDIYKIGDIVKKDGTVGVVFEVTNGGKHGKMVSAKQSSKKLQWSSDSYERQLIGADNMYNGAYNTAKVKQIADWRHKYPAFAWCVELGKEWYLPALDELKVIYNKISTINSILSANGYETLGAGFYWSSTERGFLARRVSMGSGYTGNDLKYGNYYVRAVSAF